MHKIRIARAKALMAAQRRRSVLLFNDKRNLIEMEQNTNLAAAHSAVAGISAGRDYLPWYRVIRNQSRGAEIWLLDDIGLDGVTVDRFARELKAFDGQPITLNINSNGGDVFQGRAIASIIRSHSGPTTAKILGIAASIASCIALSCQKVIMAPESFYVVHNSWTGVVGDAKKLRKVADDLDTVNQSLIDTYINRAMGTLDKQTVQDMLDAETWVSAPQALALHWADEIEAGTQRMAACLADKSRLKGFKNIPSGLAAAHSAGQDNELWLRRRQLELLF